MGKLSALEVKNLHHDPAKGKRPVRVGDGDGLYLQVAPGTERDGEKRETKSWLFRYTLHGKSREMGLGTVGEPPAGVPLAEARKRAKAARALLDEGRDPIEERKRSARERQVMRKAEAEAEKRTFRAVAALCIAAEKPGWKNERTSQQWESSLKAHVYPVIGDVPVADVDRAMVMEAVSGVWTSKPAIGRKVLHRVAMVLRYAAAHGWRANDNPADGKMLRHAGLPPQSGSTPHPSLPWTRVSTFLEALDAMPGLAPLALRLTILTALRSGEARTARWSWLSFDGAPTLTVPGRTMKGKQSQTVLPHRVPLTPAAIETLARAYSLATGVPVTATELPRLVPLMRDAPIFPSAKRNTPLSDMALSAVVRRMNADRPEGEPPLWRDPDGRPTVPHGFRATFSTWVDDTRPHEHEAREKALAHQIENKASAVYRRSDLFDRRITLMAEWASHCTTPAQAPAHVATVRVEGKGP